MFYRDIADVIPERDIVCVSPHYDDFLFFLGGYVLELGANGLLDAKRFVNINTFSRSNYQERDVIGNRDRSLKRVQYATGIRFIEDLECMDDLLGAHNYVYRAMGEEESQVRGKSFNEGEGEMEMAVGSYEAMEQADYGILERMAACIAGLLGREDTAVVLPLSMKGHIDHFIVREAGMKALKGFPCAPASVYFAEDKPYAGLLGEAEQADTDAFIARHALVDKAFRHHPEEVLRLAYLHYPSQTDEVYDRGVLARGGQLREFYNVRVDCDRVFQYGRETK
jgi:hypothetical protein